jgi:hypothetical protein
LPLWSIETAGKLGRPRQACREPEQLPGPQCEPVSRKVGLVQAIPKLEEA